MDSSNNVLYLLQNLLYRNFPLPKIHDINYLLSILKKKSYIQYPKLTNQCSNCFNYLEPSPVYFLESVKHTGLVSFGHRL